jgi:hypothetical protein
LETRRLWGTKGVGIDEITYRMILLLEEQLCVCVIGDASISECVALGCIFKVLEEERAGKGVGYPEPEDFARATPV